MQACRLLLQYGVDPSIVSLQGYTAAQLATDSVQKMLRGKKKTLLYVLQKMLAQSIANDKHAFRVSRAWSKNSGQKH